MLSFRKSYRSPKNGWVTTFRNGENVASLYRNDQGITIYWSLKRNRVYKRHLHDEKEAIDFANEIISAPTGITPDDESEEHEALRVSE